jgi:hypothetical protein
MEQAPPPGAVRWLGYTAAAWCLGFAGVSVWLVAGMAGEPGQAGLVILSVAALVLKLAGAADFGVLAVWFHPAPPPGLDLGGGRAGRCAAAARAAPGGGPGDPGPLGPAAHLTRPGGAGSR